MSDRPLKLSREDAQIIANGLNAVYVKLNDALADTLRLGATMIDTASEMGLDPKSSQKIFESVSSCANDIIQGRKNLIAAHSGAHAVRMRKSSMKETLWGCPVPYISSEPDMPIDMPSAAQAA